MGPGLDSHAAQLILSQVITQGYGQGRSAPQAWGLAQRQTSRKANSGLGIRVRTLYHDRYSASRSLQISKPHRHVALPGKAVGCSWGGAGKPTRHRVPKQAFSRNVSREIRQDESQSLFVRKEVLPRPYLFNLSHGEENLHLLHNYLTT